MFRKTTLTMLLLAFTGFPGHAQQANSTPAAAAKSWWQAVTYGDTAYVAAHSTGSLAVTFSNGQSFTPPEFLAQVARHNMGAVVSAEWSEVREQLPAAQTAIVSCRVAERVGNSMNRLKFLTVLVMEGTDWKVAAAQSTRVLEPAPRLPAGAVGSLADLAGKYRTPAGALLHVIDRGSSLSLIEPSGAETKLEAVGPGIFEGPSVSFAGNLRFAFNRDAAGKVISLTRIAHTIVTMPRVP